MGVKGVQNVPSLQRGGARPKGFREVTTLTGLSSWSPPRSRSQAATQFARLEHERTRLEDELLSRTVIQRELQARLARVHEHLAAVRPMLDTFPGEGCGRTFSAETTAAEDPGRQPGDASGDEPRPEETYPTMSLEY